MRPAPGLEQEAFQRSRSGNVAEARQRLSLDFPHALAGYAEQRADLLERHRLLALQSEIQSQDLRLALLEGRQDFLDRLRQGVLEDLVVGTRVRGVREIVEQLVVLARGERGIEREVGLRDGQRLRHLFLGDVHPFGDLFNKLLDYLPDTTNPGPDDEIFEHALTESIEEVLATLKEREAKILRLYFGLEGQEPMTLEEIGSLLGITRERARQIKEKALARLRHVSRARALESFLF